MVPRKLHVATAFFNYSGNGGISCEHPSIRDWWGTTLVKMKSDERVASVSSFDLSDTPITMTRNAAVLKARNAGIDVLLMVDSDQFPDLYVGRNPEAKPFWDSSFDFLYAHYDKGPCVIAAPYCGPPPNEPVLVFRLVDFESGCPDDAPWKIEMYTRHEAASLGGIHPAASLATGLMMIDMRATDLTKPQRAGDKPWFYYEYTDLYESIKGSTEDVTFTRNIMLTGYEKLGYNPLFCNWDSWAGHMKSKCVGKPLAMTVDRIHQNLVRAVAEGRQSDERVTWIHASPHEGNGHCEGDIVETAHAPSGAR